MKLGSMCIWLIVALLVSAVGVPSASGVTISGTEPLAEANAFASSQIATLVDWFGGQNDYLGSTVAVGNDTALVGAPGSLTGKALVFGRNTGGTDYWGSVTLVTEDVLAEYSNFGSSVSLSGDLAVVGAPFWGDPARGAVYIFDRNRCPTVFCWGQVARLTANDGAEGDDFGTAVAFDGDTLVVGSLATVAGHNGQGAVYVFDPNQNWGQVAKLTAADGEAGDCFGIVVSVGGDTAVIGATNAAAGGNPYRGAAYVFARDGGSNDWAFVKKLFAPDGTYDGMFGRSVAAEGDTIVVGGGGTEAAYVFGRDKGGLGNWGLIKKLVAPTGLGLQEFGGAVSLSGDLLAVYGYGGGYGMVLIFARDEGGADNWGVVARIMPTSPVYADGFGNVVSMKGDMVAAGAPWTDFNYDLRRGVAYLFRLLEPLHLPIVAK